MFTILKDRKLSYEPALYRWEHAHAINYIEHPEQYNHYTKQNILHLCFMRRISPLNITLYFPNTLALTPFPTEDRFNLWYRPIFGGRRLIFRPITHRGILNPFEGCGYFGPYLLADKPHLLCYHF